MSWMDFKTAQAMKAQKLASEARKQKNGDIQKAAGESKPQITTQSMGRGIGAPKATRRVQGVSKNSRMTFAPGAMQPMAKADARACENNPNVQANAAPVRPAETFSAKPATSYPIEEYSYDVAETTTAAVQDQGYDDGGYGGYDDAGYEEGAYQEGGYDEGGYEGYEEGGYEEGYEEGGYDEGGYDEGYYDEGYDEGY